MPSLKIKSCIFKIVLRLIIVAVDKLLLNSSGSVISSVDKWYIGNVLE